MDSLHQKETTKNPTTAAKCISHEPTPCTKPSCFFCTMEEPDPILRISKLTKCFKQIPLIDDQSHILTLSGLWNIAMAQPNNPEFPSLGIFQSMAQLIQKSLNDPQWLLDHQNIFIPYYAAHIIGSYTMNKPQFAVIAVDSDVIFPLMELLRGKITWVEQRVAARALGHLARHEETFKAIEVHEKEVIELAMGISLTCLKHVYHKFIGVEGSERLKYHCDLLTRGKVGGLEMENTKAEEWASQLQCWSLYLINCFARKGRETSLSLICKKTYLKNLCEMWGGFENYKSSPGGIGIIRIVCNTTIGRKNVAETQEVVQTLCNLSRSSDEWRFMAIESLLLLLKDPVTRFKLLDYVVHFLVDLVELESFNNGVGAKKTGDVITQTLLHDYHKIKYGKMKSIKTETEKALEEVWELKVEKKRREKLMSEQEVRERKLEVDVNKKQGNHFFRSGKIKEAIGLYSEALDLSLTKMTRERVVLYSNRAQCFLLMGKAEEAISDTTRALCLSGAVRPHGKSLWRRSQAYDMVGLGKESLMDCLLFVSSVNAIKEKKNGSSKRVKIPYYATRMINKQMNATWIFPTAKSISCFNEEGGEGEGNVSEFNVQNRVDYMVMTMMRHMEGGMANNWN